MFAARIVLHNSWKAQTLPVIIDGIPSKDKELITKSDAHGCKTFPHPGLDWKEKYQTPRVGQILAQCKERATSSYGM